jgi:predicted Fe-Mo cluster-binding NifX family protein
MEMKVAVSATGTDVDAQVDPRFGRCQYLVIVDADTMEFEAITNSSAGAMSGAGIQAAQTVADRGVQVVITGNVGPNAYQVLSSAGIRIFTGAFGTVREAVESFKNGHLTEATAPGPAGKGMGPGMGMGGGTWGSQATPLPQAAVSGPSMPPAPISREQEISLLEVQKRELQRQLEQIRRKLGELKGPSAS